MHSSKALRSPVLTDQALYTPSNARPELKPIFPLIGSIAPGCAGPAVVLADEHDMGMEVFVYRKFSRQRALEEGLDLIIGR
jgi:hypothetical protein